MLLLIALTDSAHACLSVEPTEVYEGETVSLILDVTCIDERLGSEEWEASSAADTGSFGDWSVNEDANLESRWTAPWLESDSIGQQVSIYVQTDLSDGQRSIDFVDVVVYPLPPLRSPRGVRRCRERSGGGCSRRSPLHHDE